MSRVPVEVPERLKHLAEYLSWDDAAQLTCCMESMALESSDRLDIFHRASVHADDMRELMRALPFEWDPVPPDVQKDFLKWMAERWRTNGLLDC